MSVTVYACQCPERHHLTMYPPVETLASTKAEASWLVATKAFSYDPDGLHDAHPEPVQEWATWPPETEPPADAGDQS